MRQVKISFYVEGITMDDAIYYTNYTSEDIDKEAVELKYYDSVEIPDGFYYVGGKKRNGISHFRRSR